MAKELFVVFVIIIVTNCIDCINSRNKIPRKSGKDKDFPDFGEGNIRTGFVDAFLANDYDISVDHPCDRICSLKDEAICYYQLTFEEFQSYNDEVCGLCLKYRGSYDCVGCIQTDGVKTSLRSINRQMPGPPINVCVNDEVIVDVYNLMNESCSVHWHGIDQRLFPYMDGVPFVTQVEIPRGKIFRYKFKASNHGTNFYHSHSAWQRGQGIYGTLIVRLPPRVNPHWYLYDNDSTRNSIIITDWGYNLQRRANNFLIHGRGWSSYSQGSYLGQPNVYVVRSRSRNRFRIINNVVNNVPVEYAINGHYIILIAADGTEIKPIAVNSLILNGGERFDFIFPADQAIDNYWMTVCNPLNRTLYQVAIIRYEGAPIRNPTTDPDVNQRPAGLQVNTLSVGPGTPGTVTIAELEGLSPVTWLSKVQWQTIYLEIGVNLSYLTFEIDKISMAFPQLPLLVEKDRLDERAFCNRSSLAQQGIDCSQVTCKCLHVIKFDLNSYIEIIFFSEGVHPTHLHGYLFYVVGMGIITSQPITRQLIMGMDRRGELPRNNNSPVLKDTIQVPRNGYVIIRIYTYNPGYWLLHCHIELHALLGMSAVVQIGQPNQMEPQPKNYQPYPT